MIVFPSRITLLSSPCRVGSLITCQRICHCICFEFALDLSYDCGQLSEYLVILSPSNLNFNHNQLTCQDICHCICFENSSFSLRVFFSCELEFELSSNLARVSNYIVMCPGILICRDIGTKKQQLNPLTQKRKFTV